MLGTALPTFAIDLLSQLNNDSITLTVTALLWAPPSPKPAIFSALFAHRTLVPESPEPASKLHAER